MRGPVSGYVGGIPIANSYYSGDLTKMSDQELEARRKVLIAADPGDEDSDEGFMNRQAEIGAIGEELDRRKTDKQDK